jgi:hypothetical protein
MNEIEKCIQSRDIELHSPFGYEDSSAVKAEDAKFEKTGIHH